MDPLPFQIITHPLYLTHPDEFLQVLHLVDQIFHTHPHLSLNDVQEKCLALQPKINQEILLAAIHLEQQFKIHPPSRSVQPADEILWDTDID